MVLSLHFSLSEIWHYIEKESERADETARLGAKAVFGLCPENCPCVLCLYDYLTKCYRVFQRDGLGWQDEWTRTGRVLPTFSSGARVPRALPLPGTARSLTLLVPLTSAPRPRGCLCAGRGT